MEIKDLILGMLIVSAVVIAAGQSIGDFFTHYNIEGKESLETVNKMNEISESLDTYGERLSTSQVEVLEGGFIGILKGAWDTIKLFLHLPGIFSAMLNDVAVFLHLPSWFVKLMFAAVTVVVIFGVLRYITKV